MFRTASLVVGLVMLWAAASPPTVGASADPVLTFAEQMNVRSRPAPMAMGVPLFVGDGTPFPSGPPNEIVQVGLDGFTYPAGISADQLATPSIPSVEDVEPGDPNWLATQPGMLMVSVDLLQPLATTGAPIAEVGVSFALPGAEVLASSPFAFDPLIDRSNSVSILNLAGDEQVAHAVVSGGQWQPTTVPIPIWRALPASGERWTVGLPITATDVQITFASSDDGTVERLASSVVVPPVPTEFIDLPGLVIDPAEVVRFEMDMTPTDPRPAEETPVVETPVEETPVVETPVEETPVGETPVVETPAEDTPADETAEDAENPSGGSMLPWIVTGAGLVLLLLILGWFLLFRPKPSDRSDDGAAAAEDAPNRMGQYASPLGGPSWERSAAALVGEAQREDAPSNTDGWWAPSNAAAYHARSALMVDRDREKELRQTAGEWSGVFVNEHTLEIVYGSGDRWEELRNELGLGEPPPQLEEPMIELNEATMATAIGERVSALAEAQEPDPEGVDWGGPPGSEIPLEEFERDDPAVPSPDPKERLRNTTAYSDARGTHTPDELTDPAEFDGDGMGPIT